MKIAFLSFYSGIIYRGVETFVHELSNALADLGNDVYVYQCGPEIQGAKYKTYEIKMPVIWDKDGGGRLASLFYYDYWSLQVKKFTELSLQSMCPCDVIIPTNDGWQSILTKLWSREFNAPIAIMGMSGTSRRDFLNLWTFPNVFIGFTDYQVKWAKKYNPLVKKSKIPIGVNTRIFHPADSTINLNLKKPIILTVGALEAIKQQDLLIKSAIDLSCSVLIVGRGTLENELRGMGNELLGSERFQITSFPYEIMPDVYRACDVFAFPTSKTEAFGNVLLEAMACGLPVVTTDDPVRNEIVGEAGVFIDPGNRQSFSRGLKIALSRPWHSIPLVQARKYSLDIIAQKYLNVFANL